MYHQRFCMWAYFTSVLVLFSNLDYAGIFLRSGLLVKPSISWSISSLSRLGIYEELVLDFSGRRCFIGCIQQNVGCSHDL